MTVRFMLTLKGFHMSNNISSSCTKQAVHLIGDGCAALSLAARSVELPQHLLTVVTPDGAPEKKDHIWGFWWIKNLDKAAKLARKKWHSWSIITSEGDAVMSSDLHAYHALQRSKWETDCRQRAKQKGVSFVDQSSLSDASDTQILDSRPPLVPVGQMFQYFIGWEITAPLGSFESKTAILMDFRCDQSRGIHFIYILPFSGSEALVESTMFAPIREPDTFFETAIKNYLAEYCGVYDFSIMRIEKGGIPLGRIPLGKGGHTGFGSNGGAIRPSSGYAFAFIQKQILATIQQAKREMVKGNTSKSLVIKCPHKLVDLWMDEVFITVLRQRPEVAPKLFLRMAKALDGDEFALFLSGEAGWCLRLKVVMAMPKLAFIKAIVFLLSGKLVPIRNIDVTEPTTTRGTDYN
jgi:lycopene beta-cyclase